MKDASFRHSKRDRNSKGVGKLVYLREGFLAKSLLVYLREGFLAKRIPKFETEKAETIYIEITIAKKKWCILFAYRPPNFSKTEFFEEISVTLNKALNKYDNLLLAGDLSINTLRPTSDLSNHLSDLNDTFSLTNLVTDSACFKSNKGTLIDLMLTNKPKRFYKSHSFVTGLSDCHKLIVSIQKPPPKFVIYRDQKNFHESNFLRNLDSRLIQGELYKNCEDPYTKLSEIFSEVLNYHAPLKQKSVRGNHAPFMTTEPSKGIMTKPKVKNSYVKWLSRENFVVYEKAKNKCNSLTRKAKRKFFKEATKSGVMSNRTFWKTVKPFLINKGCMTNDCISTEKDGDIVRDEKVLVELFKLAIILRKL